MNLIKYIKITIISLLATAFIPAFAFVDNKDYKLNENLHDFIPVYTNNKRIPWDFWSAKYEFAITLLHDVKTDPKPSSSLDNMFLGFRDPNTKVKVMCYKIDPGHSHILDSYQVAVRKLDELEETIPFTIPGLEHSNKVNVYLKVQRNMLDIKVKDSGKWWGLFKTYSPSRVFNVELAVDHRPQKT